MESGRFFLGVALTVFLAFCAVLYKLVKKQAPVFFFVLLVSACTVLALVPAISLGADTHDTESERFLYLASVFTCILMAVMLCALLQDKRWRYGLFFLLLVLHLSFLYQASKAYRYASALSRTIIETLNRFPSVKQVTFYQLPTQYKGALLFRIGFPKYAPGLLPATYDSVHILSFKDVLHSGQWQVENKVTAQNPLHLVVEFGDHKIILRDSTKVSN